MRLLPNFVDDQRQTDDDGFSKSSEDWKAAGLGRRWNTCRGEGVSGVH